MSGISGPTGPPLHSLAFRLAVTGKAATALFADRIAEHGLRPPLVAVLSAAASGPATQQDVARALDVVPSVVVEAVDELQRLGAVRRTRDPQDRRRSLLSLTPRGEQLLAASGAAAAAVDAELTATLDADEVRVLADLLARVGRQVGVPGADGYPGDMATGLSGPDRSTPDGPLRRGASETIHHLVVPPSGHGDPE